MVVEAKSSHNPLSSGGSAGRNTDGTNQGQNKNNDNYDEVWKATWFRIAALVFQYGARSQIRLGVMSA